MQPYCECAEMKRESSVVKCVEICEVCVWLAPRQMMRTMRVSVHESEDGDVQCVPELSHHQPAVHIWHAFTLIHPNNTCYVYRTLILLYFETRQCSN